MADKHFEATGHATAPQPSGQYQQQGYSVPNTNPPSYSAVQAQPMAPGYAQYPQTQAQPIPGYSQYPQGQLMDGSYPQYPQGQQTVSVVTVAPQSLVIQEPQGPPPNDYLVFSILTTLFCFFPLGIAAIVFSVKTRSAIQAGNYAQAKSSSSTAKILNIVALAVGIFVIVIILIAQLAWIIPVVILSSLIR